MYFLGGFLRRYAKYSIGCVVLLASAWMMLLRAQYASPIPINQWTSIAHMSTARSAACAATLQDGRVLVGGGYSGSGVTNTVELFSTSGSSAGTFAPAPSMQVARASGACV